MCLAITTSIMIHWMLFQVFVAPLGLQGNLVSKEDLADLVNRALLENEVNVDQLDPVMNEENRDQQAQ